MDAKEISYTSSGRQSQQRGISQTVATESCLRIYEALGTRGGNKSVICLVLTATVSLRGSSQAYCLLTGWPRGPMDPVGPCSNKKGGKRSSVRK